MPRDAVSVFTARVVFKSGMGHFALSSQPLPTNKNRGLSVGLGVKKRFHLQLGFFNNFYSDPKQFSTPFITAAAIAHMWQNKRVEQVWLGALCSSSINSSSSVASVRQHQA